jgi:hypothetical protein
VQYPVLGALKIGSFITCISKRTVALICLVLLLGWQKQKIYRCLVSFMKGLIEGE